MSKSASCSSAKASGASGARCIDAVGLNVSSCSEAFTACFIRGRFPLHLHSPALPHDNNRDWGCSSHAYHCRHFPIARCTFLPFNKISTTAASLFFLCKDSPARALQVPLLKQVHSHISAQNFNTLSAFSSSRHAVPWMQIQGFFRCNN